MGRITLATCREWPVPEGDQPLRKVLAARGHVVSSAPWDGEQGVFYDADVVIVRACWDYSESADAFTEWIAALERASINLHNPPHILRCNMSKRYLLELQARGARIPETVVVDALPSERLLGEIAGRGWHEAVAKPLVGQSGRDVVRLDPEGYDEWPSLSNAGVQIILQEYQPGISSLGETMLVFFAGRFSHAFRRIVAPGEWRSNSRYGAHRVKCDVSSAVIRQAQEVLSVLRETPLYARVDGIVEDDRLTVMELELIEPDLGFAQVPEAAEKFADQIEHRLRPEPGSV